MSKNIKDLLGMTYNDMAMLLQINRSQWAMYITGKRDLPVVAKLKLAEMLQFLQQKDNEAYKTVEHDETQNQKVKQFLESQEDLNRNLQIITKQKLKVIEKKYETAVTALKFISFIETNMQKPTKEYQLLLHTIRLNAEIEMEKNSLTAQAKLQFKYEILIAEAQILIMKKKKLIDNISTNDII